MSFLDRQNTVAGPRFNRWLVPPAALAVHLSIGQVYAFSVFKLPLTKIIGVQNSAPGDWTQPSLAWIFSIAIAFLGISAAVFGRWVEKNGPRKTMFASACCFGVDFSSPRWELRGISSGLSILGTVSLADAALVWVTSLRFRLW